ncbi:MAG: VOC family protein [Chloroflexi bacterium]|nr:VOC family protein [Chloroflexota bacterium]
MLKPKRSNVILYCQQWAKTVDFYEHILGFEVNFRSGWFVEFLVHAGSYVSIADETRSTIKSSTGDGITLPWQGDELEAVHAALVEQGVQVTDIAHKWGSLVCYLYDPEGHRLELWQAESTS